MRFRIKAGGPAARITFDRPPKPQPPAPPVLRLQNNDEKAEKKWEEYLDYLAVLISNLRMAYDMDIILGGEMGGYLSDYMIPLGEKVMKYNGFDHDLRYLKNCSYKKEASAVGVAKHFLQDFIGKI